MAPEEKKEAEAAPVSMGSTSSGGGGGNKIVLILTLVNVIATIAAIGVVLLSFQNKKKAGVEDITTHSSPGDKKDGHGDGKEGGGEKKKGIEFGKMVTLEQFTINLSTPGSATPKFVRVNISLEVPNDDAESEVNQKMPQVRNAIIDLFNSKRPSDLATAEGRDYLKEEIRNALNSFMVSGKVRGVFFTNFAVAG
ncbi:MAG: hypothetical protein A2583_02365 [Bdellovibrionales bacterium RIFOXYD1_FULL_53_11]|nr:MAG: hypothetical protein A2583_02365 [Bdellovibrionales bacterium RIFOXYD1_FULL_53_11]